MEPMSRREFLKYTGSAALLGMMYGAEAFASESRSQVFERYIFVDLGKIMLKVMEYDGGKGICTPRKNYKVTLGADNTTPKGSFLIGDVLKKPDWWPPKRNDKYEKWVSEKQKEIAGEHGGKIPYGYKENPMGEYAISLLYPETGKTAGILIHGNGDGTVGTRVSHGCIRMRNRDIADLSGRVKRRDFVLIGQDISLNSPL